MITGELKSKVDRIWDTMWSSGISNPLSVIEQLTYLLFIKGLDELHTRKELKAARAASSRQPLTRSQVSADTAPTAACNADFFGGASSSTRTNRQADRESSNANARPRQVSPADVSARRRAESTRRSIRRGPAPTGRRGRRAAVGIDSSVSWASAAWQPPGVLVCFCFV